MTTTTYFVKGYGYYENGTKQEFQGLIDVVNPNSSTIVQEIEESFRFSPYRHKREIIIEQINIVATITK